MKQLRLFSTSVVYGSGYLDYCADEVKRFFAGREKIYFVPYARPSGISHDDYFEKARTTFESFGLVIHALHHESNPAQALEKAEGVFTSGGNTFLLLKQVSRMVLSGYRMVATAGSSSSSSSSSSRYLPSVCPSLVSDEEDIRVEEGLESSGMLLYT